MTVPSTARRAGPYTGTGTQTAFPFAFRVFSATDVRVVLSSAGVETVLSTGYSVSINADQDATPGGTVNMVVAPTVSQTLAITGGTPYSQTLDLPAGGSYSPRALENALDRMVFQIQQLAETQGRALTAPATSNAGGALPAPVPGNVLGWDAGGTALQNLDPATLVTITAYANRRTLVADGGAASYTLAADPGNASNTMVAVAGVVQTPGVDYTVSGTTLTPTAPWPAGTDNVVVVYGEALPVGVADAGAVNFAPTAGYSYDTVGYAAQRALALSMFPGADPTGVADSFVAINTALATAAALHLPLLIDGRYRHSNTVVVPARVALRGTGWTSDSSVSGRSHSTLIKTFNGLGVLFSGDDAGSDGVVFDALAGTTGDGVQVTGSRVRLLGGGVTNQGGDGLRVGKTEAGASSINANCGALSHFQVLNCGGWGINFDHTNTSTGATFPLGAPDCNAWTIDHVVVGASGQPCVLGGIKLGNTIDNVITHAVIQNNTGPAIKFTTSSRGHVVTAYCEGNGSGPVFDAGAKYNVLRLTQTLITGNEAVDNDGSNVISRALVATGGWADNQSVVADLSVGGVARNTRYAGVNADKVAEDRAQVAGTSGGKWTLATKADGGVLADRVVVTEKGVHQTLFGSAQALVFLTYGATVAIDAALGNRYQINVTNGTAWALSTPTNPTNGQAITLCVRNTSGGAAGAITWPAIFKMSAWTNPANGFSRSITVRYDGQYWVEESRTPADVPN